MIGFCLNSSTTLVDFVAAEHSTSSKFFYASSTVFCNWYNACSTFKPSCAATRICTKEESSWKNVENNSNVATAGRNLISKKMQKITKKTARSAIKYPSGTNSIENSIKLCFKTATTQG